MLGTELLEYMDKKDGTEGAMLIAEVDMKNKVDEILREKFFMEKEDAFFHRSLCYVFDRTPLEKRRNRYWGRIRKENYEKSGHRPTFVTSLFDDYPKVEEVSLYRLLLIEDFKRTLK